MERKTTIDIIPVIPVTFRCYEMFFSSLQKQNKIYVKYFIETWIAHNNIVPGKCGYKKNY
jgi:hypothetical protein